MLARDHIFPDGNKCTALVVSLAIMSMKGSSLSFLIRKTLLAMKYIDGFRMLFQGM